MYELANEYFTSKLLSSIHSHIIQENHVNPDKHTACDYLPGLVCKRKHGEIKENSQNDENKVKLHENNW